MKIVIGDLTEIQADAIINPANTFKLAQKLKLKSVATPLLGAGVVGLDKAEVEKILSEVSSQFPQLEVILVKRN